MIAVTGPGFASSEYDGVVEIRSRQRMQSKAIVSTRHSNSRFKYPDGEEGAVMVSRGD